MLGGGESSCQCISRSSLGTAQPLAEPELQFRGPHGERGARAYNGGLGADRAPSGVQGQSPWSGVRGAESILALGCPTDTANLHPWPVAVFSV